MGGWQLDQEVHVDNHMRISGFNMHRNLNLYGYSSQIYVFNSFFLNCKFGEFRSSKQNWSPFRKLCICLICHHIALRPCPFHVTLCISYSNPQEDLQVDKCIVMTVVDNNNTGLKIVKDLHVTIYSVCFIFICSLIIKGDDLHFKKH